MSSHGDPALAFGPRPDANGAPTGAGATNTLVLAWPDARAGLNHEQALVRTSTNQGLSWSAPVNAAEVGDRPDNPAVAISPTGSDLYLVYNAYLQPFQTTTANPRNMLGVVRHANLSAGGAVGGLVDPAPRGGRRCPGHDQDPEPRGW
jgi:hypothetical protein